MRVYEPCLGVELKEKREMMGRDCGGASEEMGEKLREAR